MKQIIKRIIYIASLSIAFIFIFSFFNQKSFSTNNQVINKKEYKNIQIKPIAQVGIAITTNIGMGKTQKNDFENINKEILSIDDFYYNNNKIEKMIKENMIFSQEYHNILKTNFADLIKNSKSKEKTLNNLLKQLKIRYKKTSEILSNLNKQKGVLVTEYDKINTQIETTKRKIEYNFNKSNTSEVLKNVDLYYSLKGKETKIKTNIIFINNFIKRYKILNNYNYYILEGLSLNKDAIVKNSYVVIPKSGTKLLKDFELLYSENEYKNKQKK